MKLKMTILYGLRALVVWGIFLWARMVSGADISLTGPSTPVTVRDGEDFAEQILGNPWSMDRLRDIPFEMGFNQPTATSGIWSATSTLAGAPSFFLLNTGFPNPQYQNVTMMYSVSDAMPFGPLNPIRAGKYRRLSFRTSLQQSHRASINVQWSNDKTVWPVEIAKSSNVGYAQLLDVKPTYNGGTPLQVKNESGFRLYNIDLAGADPDASEVLSWLRSPAASYGQAAWTNTMYGLIIIPSTALPAGAPVSVDWARLYDPLSSPEVPITWSTTGVPTGDNPADPFYSVWLFIDRDGAGYDGDLLISGLKNDGAYTLKTAALPPGNYYVYLQVVYHQNGGFQVVATSDYSAPIQIGYPPFVQFEAPTRTSGPDYATVELGNPWDMSSAADIDRTYQVGSPQFSGGMMSGVAPASLDNMIFLNLKKNGVTVPIDTQRYRYLTYRFKADSSGGPDLWSRMIRGWVVKLAWWNQDLARDGSYSRDLHIFEDFHSYSVDLRDNTLLNPSAPYRAGLEEIPRVTTLRFDPLESDVNVPFWLDDVRLCADNSPTGGIYEVVCRLTDPDTPTVNLKLFYGYYTPLGYQEMSAPLIDVQLTNGSQRLIWNMAGLANDSYYLRAEVTDGIHTNSEMADVPVVVTNSFPRMTVAGMDPTVFNRRTGNWHILFAGQGSAATHQWGWAGVDPVSGDYDGDGISDLAVFDQNTGRWFIRKVTGEILGWSIFWGWPGVTPVPGDYNGDGTNDLAVFDQNTGRWFIRKITGEILGWSIFWGWPGVKPVSGDYDGDGISDLAVFDQNTGRWFIRKISGEILGWSIFWGWPGVTPVPGDYDGDGVDDLAIFDQNTGRWFIRKISGSILKWENYWGFAGAVPVPGDYNADGIADQVVYYEGNGLWYFLFSNGTMDIGGPWTGVGVTPVPGNYDGL